MEFLSPNRDFLFTYPLADLSGLFKDHFLRFTSGFNSQYFQSPIRANPCSE